MATVEPRSYASTAAAVSTASDLLASVAEWGQTVAAERAKSDGDDCAVPFGEGAEGGDGDGQKKGGNKHEIRILSATTNLVLCETQNFTNTQA